MLEVWARAPCSDNPFHHAPKEPGEASQCRGPKIAANCFATPTPTYKANLWTKTWPKNVDFPSFSAIPAKFCQMFVDAFALYVGWFLAYFWISLTHSQFGAVQCRCTRNQTRTLPLTCCSEERFLSTPVKPRNLKEGPPFLTFFFLLLFLHAFCLVYLLFACS